MDTRNFEVLYTHQKLKKAKTWKDGCLKISSSGTKAVLCDDQGCSLEVFHIHSHKIFPGSDVECERYLISIGDEKTTQDTTQDHSKTRLVAADSSNYSRCATGNASALKSDIRCPFGKRKRTGHDTFRPNLPRPRHDFNPDIRSSQMCDFNKRRPNLEYNEPSRKTRQGTIVMSSDCNYATRTNFECEQVVSTSDENEFYPWKGDEETVIKLQRPADNFSARGTSLKCNQMAPNGPNDFPSWTVCQGRTVNSNRSSQKSDVRTATVNFSKLPSNSRGENSFSDSLGSFQEKNENSFSAQKRSRLELLSLFGGKSRNVPDKQKQDPLYDETVAPLEQNFPSSKNSKNISHDKMFPKTNNLFSEAFDISLGDENDFSESSFQNLNNPMSSTKYNTATDMICRLGGQPQWDSIQTAFQDCEDVDDEYIDPEIENILAGYDDYNSDTNNGTSLTTSRFDNIPWKSGESDMTKDCNISDNKHFNEEIDADDSDDNELAMFNTFSKTPKSCQGVEYKYENFSNPRNYLTSIRNDLPGSKSSESQVHTSSNVLVNKHFDSEFDNVIFYDEACMFSTSSGRSVAFGRGTKNVIEGFGNGNTHRVTVDDCTFDPLHQNSTEVEVLNNMSSTSNSFLQSRSHLTSKRTKFISPLMTSVNNNVSGSSIHQKDHRSSKVEQVTAEPSSRPQSFSGELYFPSDTECCGSVTPTRQVAIPTRFSSVIDYKSVLKSTLREHLNIILFELAQKYHGMLSKADITSSDDILSDQKENLKGPSCSHGSAKLRAVKKDGPNKVFKHFQLKHCASSKTSVTGRHFYTCPGSGSNQCKFFQWADESHTTSTTGNKKISLTSSDSIRTFFKSKGVYFYHKCLLERRSQPKKNFFGKKYTRKGSNMDSGKKAMYIVLKYRDSSSLYTKDDIWIISKSMNFEPRTTFIAKSSFYGPSSNGDLEIEPISGYSPSNWRSGDTVHAIWACNAGTELSCIQNLDSHVTLQQMPLLPYILNGSHPSYISQRCQHSSFSTPLSSSIDRNSLGISWPVIEQETEKMIALYKLNTDQATALHSSAKMFVSANEEQMQCLPITLIHGVFGAGKSFLLAIVVLLMVRLFEVADTSEEGGTAQSITWKILISSTTNVAVDRILLGLLELGFDQFVRVGSVRKIAKPVLPYSIHSIGTESQELKELQSMMKTELTSSEKAYVRKSIEMHKLGENRKRLASVRVVGVTCAACGFTALERLKFPVLLLDECSQMTEPTSLLPMARFGCRKLILVGDPKQLNPTIQGSEPSSESGLEQTLFDRLIKMDMKPILLRMQYRCHPLISSISNRLFYKDQLLDGVTAEDRRPLVDFLPTLCFYNVSSGKEECSQDGSYFNSAEAKFVVVLIKSLLESDVEPKQIGVITQYKSQLTAITNSLSTDGATSYKEWAGIQISTVDAFQGGEKDVIILSCVRTKHIGFIDCKRRTNVALTRAKRHLCIVGCGKILSSNALWSKILKFCRDSPEGFQSSEFYNKQWNERRPKVDDNPTTSTSSKGKKPRKSRKNVGAKITSTASRKIRQQQDASTEAVSISDSSYDTRSELIEVENVLDSDHAFNYEDTYHDELSNFVDNADEGIEIGDEAVAIPDNTGNPDNTGKAFEISDKTIAIEISDNSEEQGISNDDGEVFERSNTEAINQGSRMSKEITVVEKKAKFSPTSCYQDIFSDDSLMDDELCNLDF